MMTAGMRVASKSLAQAEDEANDLAHQIAGHKDD